MVQIFYLNDKDQWTFWFEMLSATGRHSVHFNAPSRSSMAIFKLETAFADSPLHALQTRLSQHRLPQRLRFPHVQNPAFWRPNSVCPNKCRWWSTLLRWSIGLRPVDGCIKTSPIYHRNSFTSSWPDMFELCWRRQFFYCSWRKTFA